MKTNRNLSLQRACMRVVRWMAVNALLGAACGGLFGLVFGGFGAALHGEPWKLIWTAGYFAVWGAIAGALVGIGSGISDAREKVSASTNLLREEADKKEPAAEAVRQLLVPRQRQSQNGPAVAASADRRRALTAVTKHPLSC